MTLLLLFGGGSSAAVPSGAGVAGPAGSTIHVEWSPTTDPMEEPMWVDISDRVRFAAGILIDRGRSYELDDFQTGSCKLVLSNVDRAFDPDYDAGGYFGNLLPLRRLRVIVTYAGVNYSRFQGFIVGWPQRYDISKEEAIIPLEARDAFWLLSQGGLAESGFTVGSSTLGIVGTSRVGGGVAGTAEKSGARIGTVLDLDGWPASLRDLDTGESTMNVESPSQSDPLSYTKRVEKSEDGFLFVNRDGQVAFRSRHSRYTNPRMTAVQATFSDDGADGAYNDIGTDYDAERVYNDVRRTADGGTEQAVEDSDSIRSYRRRLSSDSGLLLTSNSETRGLAQSFLNRHSQPQTRLPTVGIRPLRDPATTFPDWLERELLDLLRVEHTPMNLGDPQIFDVLLEGYSERIDTFSFDVSANCSPQYDPEPLVVGDPTRGLVGSRRVVF